MGFMPIRPPAGPPLKLRIDHVEAMRLYDLEGFDQTEAAAQMGISRATFGRIIKEAHRTIAEALLSGRGVVVVATTPLEVECEGVFRFRPPGFRRGKPDR